MEQDATQSFGNRLTAAALGVTVMKWNETEENDGVNDKHVMGFRVTLTLNI